MNPTDPTPSGAEQPTPELPRGVSVILYRRGYFAISQRLNTEGQPGLFQFAGGHVEAGELSIVAAQRELVEETGLSLPLERFIFLGKTDPLTGYKGDQYIGYRYAVILKDGEEPQRTEPTKATDWVWYPADAMRGLKMLQQTQNYAYAFHSGITALQTTHLAAPRDKVSPPPEATGAAQEDMETLRFIRNRCRVIYYPAGGGYPIEHTLAAKKNMWAQILEAKESPFEQITAHAPKEQPASAAVREGDAK